MPTRCKGGTVLVEYMADNAIIGEIKSKICNSIFFENMLCFLWGK